jgi:hypothetical protein
MGVQRTARTVATIGFLFCAMIAKPAAADEIIGMTFYADFYRIDPLTGKTTLLYPLCGGRFCGPWFGATGSPDAGTILAASVVNLWEFNVKTFEGTPIGGLSALDIAFDPSKNTLYDTSGSALFSVRCTSVTSICDETQVGPGFPTSHMQALGYVPGAGLYGVSDDFLYRIDDATGVAAPVGATGLPDPTKGITDLAFDPATGGLIASAGCSEFDWNPTGSCAESQGSIYLVDRFTGQATLLNGNAPLLTGLAEVTPEPGGAFLLAAALGVLLVLPGARRRAQSRQTVDALWSSGS